MKRLLGIAILVLFLAGCISSIVSNTLYQYKRANSGAAVPEEAPSPMKKIDLLDEAGNRTVGWYYEYSQVAPVVLYFHGNASNILSNYAGGFGEKMQSLKVNFAIFDYPKYGLSTGELNQKSVIRSSQQVFDFLRSKFPNSRFIIWGRSLGCAPATIIAKNNQLEVAKLILTSPWDSFWKMVRFRTNMSEKSCRKAVKGNEYETEIHAKSITMPVLIHHGTEDNVVPWEMGKNLSEAFAGEKVFFESVEGAGHNNLLSDNEWQAIFQFIKY